MNIVVSVCQRKCCVHVETHHFHQEKRFSSPFKDIHYIFKIYYIHMQRRCQSQPRKGAKRLQLFELHFIDIYCILPLFFCNTSYFISSSFNPQNIILNFYPRFTVYAPSNNVPKQMPLHLHSIIIVIWFSAAHCHQIQNLHHSLVLQTVMSLALSPLINLTVHMVPEPHDPDLPPAAAGGQEGYLFLHGCVFVWPAQQEETGVFGV